MLSSSFCLPRFLLRGWFFTYRSTAGIRTQSTPYAVYAFRTLLRSSYRQSRRFRSPAETTHLELTLSVYGYHFLWFRFSSLSVSFPVVAFLVGGLSALWLVSRFPWFLSLPRALLLCLFRYFIFFLCSFPLGSAGSTVLSVFRVSRFPGSSELLASLISFSKSIFHFDEPSETSSALL